MDVRIMVYTVYDNCKFHCRIKDVFVTVQYGDGYLLLLNFSHGNMGCYVIIHGKMVVIRKFTVVAWV